MPFKLPEETRRICKSKPSNSNELGYFDTDSGKQDYRLLKSFDRSFHIAGIEVTGTGFIAFFAENEKLADITLEKPRYNVRDLDITQMIPKRLILTWRIHTVREWLNSI